MDTYLRKTLQTITKLKCKCIIAGDFNVDLIKYGDNQSHDMFYDELSSHCFRPLILQPTRVTSKTFSLIDNIFTNDITCFSTGGNLTTSVSDHFSQFSQIDIFDATKQKNPTKFGRNWRIFNKNEFENELRTCSWTDVTSPEITTNTGFNNFYHKIEKLLDEMAPIKRLTKREIGLKQRPWIDHDIMTLMFERDKLHKEFCTEKHNALRDEKYKLYKEKRNMVTSKIRKAKKDNFNSFFEENINNIKETWKGIRSLINVSKKSVTSINKLIEGGQTITDPKDMADLMNKFYVNIGKSIDDKIPKGPKLFHYYLENANPFNIVLNPCTPDEVKKYVSNLTPSKASGPYSIPTSILRNHVDQLIEPLTVILNKSLSDGIFPDLLKSASVCPIFKKNERTKCENYRPISLLSNLSKIFERAMYNRIDTFLANFNIIYNRQFGFRKKYSTEHALLCIVEEIRKTSMMEFFPVEFLFSYWFQLLEE